MSVEIEMKLRKLNNTIRSSSMRALDVSIAKTKDDFASVGGMRELKSTLVMSVLAGLRRPEAYLRFGLNLPTGILLYGPPGCGKTKIAKCLATEARMNFVAVSAADVYSPYVGAAEQIITDLFNCARKNSPCLVFLDEIDALVGRRGLSTDAKEDTQKRILCTLLLEIDGFVTTDTTLRNKQILVVGATNRPDMIDDALLRPGRFDKLIHVPPPDLESRWAILKLYASCMPFAKNVDLQKIAERTAHFSGADICNICNEAALRALQYNIDATQISAEDFENVLNVQKPSLSEEQVRSYVDFEGRFKVFDQVT